MPEYLDEKLNIDVLPSCNEEENVKLVRSAASGQTLLSLLHDEGGNITLYLVFEADEN